MQQQGCRSSSLTAIAPGALQLHEDAQIPQEARVYCPSKACSRALQCDASHGLALPEMCPFCEELFCCKYAPFCEKAVVLAQSCHVFTGAGASRSGMAPTPVGLLRMMTTEPSRRW